MLSRTTEFGLDDTEMVEVARNLAPALFAALGVVEALKGEFPIPSMDALLGFLFVDGIAKRSGYAPSREEVEKMCFSFPISERAELARRLYIIAARSHENAHQSMPPLATDEALR